MNIVSSFTCICVKLWLYKVNRSTHLVGFLITVLKWAKDISTGTLPDLPLKGKGIPKIDIKPIFDQYQSIGYKWYLDRGSDDGGFSDVQK